MGIKKLFVPSVLVYTLAISFLMAILTPLQEGYRYDIAVKLSLSLFAIWLFYIFKPGWGFKKVIVILALAGGLGLGFGSLISINPHSEIVKVYQCVFEALDSGKNPYTSGTIYHDAPVSQSAAAPDGRTAGTTAGTRHHPLRTEPYFGNFNYPPLEIYPYYLGRLVAGTWNSTVLTAVILVLHGLACLVMVITFPGIPRKYLWAFFPLIMFTEIKTNPSMTLLITALILWLINRDREKPRPGNRYLIAVFFGVGLMTKFLVILLMAPFGVAAVFKNTIMANLILKDRTVFATFFPNVLSGPLTWAGLDRLYPVAAVAILGAAIWMAPKLSMNSALLTAAFAFLFVAPTPEPQFVPVVLYVALAALYSGAGHKVPQLVGTREMGRAGNDRGPRPG